MGKPMLFLLCLGCLNALTQAQRKSCLQDPCGANAVCTDDGPGITCTCETGYTGDPDVKCTDIDECSDPDIAATCDENAACVNLPGSYTCTCNAGYQGDGTECADVTACSPNGPGAESTSEEADGDCPSHSKCVNTEGSYTCVCDKGYKYNRLRTKCRDINECKKGTEECDKNASCTNIPGSYTCTCNVGYQGDGFTCTRSRPGGHMLP